MPELAASNNGKKPPKVQIVSIHGHDLIESMIGSLVFSQVADPISPSPCGFWSILEATSLHTDD